MTTATQGSSSHSPEASSSSTPPSPTPKVSKKQTVDQLREGLAQLGLETKGKKETLWRRLLDAVHRAALRDPSSEDDDEVESPPEPVKIVKQPYRSYLCFDVEATCRPGKEFDYPNEIIEFPVVLLRWSEPDEDGKKTLQKIDSFRSYVRPTWRPTLTDFCTSLTGITQHTVDSSPTFPQMLKDMEKWMDKWDLRSDKGLNDAIWVTDGPWDLRMTLVYPGSHSDFVPKQLHITPPSPFPNYFHGPYLNIKQAVQSVLSEIYRRQAYATEHPNDAPNERALSAISTAKVSNLVKDKERKIKEAGPHYYFNIPGMCHALGLGEFEGRQHSGLDDASNIARILIALSAKNVVIEPNGTIAKAGQGRRYAWMGERGEVKWEEWMSSNKPLKEALKAKEEAEKDASATDKEAKGHGKTDEEKEENVGDISASSVPDNGNDEGKSLVEEKGEEKVVDIEKPNEPSK
ncbi:hypothetical protein CI109_104722 [Kwoniella shandongensis]|uniref:Uncharacterized protein n=1 Tax=Kwoniella shandongensis TaxID=1734106 RepID=A0A5M6BP86_9TREE|nr:uncharacterized protein CI109_006966 [Kwoniella shandongensis]KAA5524708.1 hypothetical protein CI109_006966 [Kwoniella shandongensis]